MNFVLPAIDFIRRQSQRSRSVGRSMRGSGRIAVVHWDREHIHYLIVTPKSKKILSTSYGSVPHADVANPFVALAEHLRQNSIQVQRLVVLLSRPELELFTLTLPPADASELPALVASEIEQQIGEADESPVIDFHVVPSTANPTDATAAAASNGVQVLAFALPIAVQQRLQSQVSGAGFRIAAICSRHLSPLGVLRRKHVPEGTPAVSVHLYAGEAELAICRGSEPVLLRSIRVNLEEPSQVAEQILLESQRCLALLPHEFTELPFNWFIYTTCEAAWQVAQALDDHDQQIAIQPVDPLIGWEVESPNDSSAQLKFATAANSGAAWEYLNGELPVDFLSPKKPPKAANPTIRWVAIAVAAALVLVTGVSFALSDVSQLRTEVQTLQGELEGTQKVTAKFKEKADQVAAIENWLSDQVDWVAELNQLSKRLPDGQNATVRRLTASTNANAAVIDLAVQVAKQETISQLEGSIRSAKYGVTSKQISQNPESVEYPWQFDTRVVFTVDPIKDINQYQSHAKQGATMKHPAPKGATANRESTP